MLPSIRSIRDHVPTFTHAITAETLGLSAILLVTFGTGIATVHQALLPAFAGDTGYKGLLLAILLYVIPVEGLVFPNFLARERPRARLLYLAVLFLAAVGSYLFFLSGWWQSLHQYIELLGLNQATTEAPPEAGQALRENFLPHIFSALLKDILLSAYIECILWDKVVKTASLGVFKTPGNSGTSPWGGSAS